MPKPKMSFEQVPLERATETPMPKPKISFEQVPLETVMETLLREVVSFVQDNAKWWDDAAQHFDDIARNLSDQEKPKWQLVAACYQERAQLHRDLVARVQPSGANGTPLTESER
jgi:uncharacterized NAD(P)/FAD-binding protein YdhS